MAATHPTIDWPRMLSAMLLVAMRLSGLFTFAPVFSSQAIPVRVKAVLLLVLAAVLAPVVAALPGAHPSLDFASICGELLISLIFGLLLSLLLEAALFTGQLVGMQFSFSLVNLLDPNSQIQTPLFGQMFSLFATTVLVTAGLHRTMLAALVRTFSFLPVGTVLLEQRIVPHILAEAGGLFIAALQLAAPVMAATMLVEVTIALTARISPQMPVLALTVPLKSVLGYVVLIGSLALWPAFFEGHFVRLLDGVQAVLLHGAERASITP